MRKVIVVPILMAIIYSAAPASAETANVAVNSFGSTAANITACPSRSDYLRFYALLDDDPIAAFNFARNHKCVELEGETTVRVDQINGDNSCVRPSGAYDCVWTSSLRIKSLVNSDTKALIEKANRVFDQTHPECKGKVKPDYCN